MPEVKVIPREVHDLEAGNGKDVTVQEEYINVPSYWTALLRMTDASWLNVNDEEEFDANRLFVGGNLNLSLICALLFTTFLPLYYNEAQRLNDNMDGLTIDILNGYLSPLVVSKNFLHDVWDCSYLIASAGTLFGTIVSVFYMLAANEANDDAKTFVMMRYLGPQLSQLPYYFFSIGIIGWALGVQLHIFTVPRLAGGFYVKVFGLWAMIFFMLFVCFPRLVRGVFLGKLESQKHPPIYISDADIKAKLDKFFANPKSNMNLTLARFLRSLTYMTELGYRPKLQTLTQVQATNMYYEKVAEMTGRTVAEVKEVLLV